MSTAKQDDLSDEMGKNKDEQSKGSTKT